MAYLRSNLVVRPAYAGIGDAVVAELGGILDDLKTFASNTVNAFGEAKKAQGAAAANAAAATTVAAPSSFPTGTVLAVGGLGLAALLILKKRKKK